MKRVLAVLVLAVLAGCGADRTIPPGQPNGVTVTGTLFGVAKITRGGIPLDARPELFWKLGENKLPVGSVWITLSPDSSEYEFRRSYPTDSLEIRIEGRVALVHPDGHFEVRGVTPGTRTLSFYLRGEPVRTQTIEVSANHPSVEVEIQKVVDVCCPPQTAPAPGAAAETFACLDNNGVWPGGFTYSDCFMSLFFGPPWYSWMCWSEAMDKVHDHYGNIWCNGSHNCSLFVHGWDWNYQRWHRHYWPWAARW